MVFHSLPLNMFNPNSAVPLVPDCLFHIMDGYLCHLSLDCPCMCTNLVSCIHQSLFTFLLIFICTWSNFLSGGHTHFLTCQKSMHHCGKYFWISIQSFSIIIQSKICRNEITMTPIASSQHHPNCSCIYSNIIVVLCSAFP